MSMQLTLPQIQAWLTQGERSLDARMVGHMRPVIERVHTDSRSLKPGDLFVALKGEHFDAHSFLPDARASGAVAALAQHGLQSAGLTGFEVADTKLALGALAAGWRQHLATPLIAVAGSNGKTTVTQMIAAILRAYLGGAAWSTQGNLNNEIGVPLTLLGLRDKHRLGVVELGMNHPGEIAYLAGLVKPQVALVNNAQREHIEFMHTVAAVARENGAVLSALDATGVAVFPADDAYTPIWHELAQSRPCLSFAVTGDSGADVYALQAQAQGATWHIQAQTPSGVVRYVLNLVGAHNLKNSLAAVACAVAAKIPLAAIAQGLNAFEAVKGRSRGLTLVSGARSIVLVDDSYNANPDSVLAAIEVLAELPAPRLLVLGDMGEVGEQGPQFHTQIGQAAAAKGLELFFTLGEQSRHAHQSFKQTQLQLQLEQSPQLQQTPSQSNGINRPRAQARHFENIADLQEATQSALPLVASILVKGSRFMQMERVVQALVAASSKLAEPTADLNKDVK